MAATNQPQDQASTILALQRELRTLRDRVGNISAYIGQGGLTIGDSGALRMVDTNGVEIVYFGPDSQGRQVLRIRRDGGSTVLYTQFTSYGTQYWRLTDRFTRELFSDDTVSGGMARPYLPVPLYPKFSMAASSTFSYMNLAVTSLVAETTLWEGRIALVSHPFLSVAGIWGAASGTNSTIYRVRVNGTEVGTWTSTALENASKGPFSITTWLGLQDVPVTITAIGTGTGLVACQPYHLTQRQTP
jgi:hypothetical protein